MSMEALYVDGPYQGVSQVPPQVRLAGACEDMQDCHAIIPFGVQKRPPIEYVGSPIANRQIITPSPALYAEIPRGSVGTDVTLILNAEGSTNNAIVPYLYLTSDATCTPIACPVSALAQTYLNQNGFELFPNQQYRIVSVEDFTFIVNTAVRVSEQTSGGSPTTAAGRPFEAIVWIKEGEYAHNYTIIVTPASGSGAGTPITANYIPSTGGNATDATGVGTEVIINALGQGSSTIPPGSNGVYTGPSGGLEAACGAVGITVSHFGPIMYLSSTSTDFTISSSDDAGGSAMIAIKSSVQNFSDLPQQAENGFVVEVLQSEGGAANSNFWVQFNASAGQFGTWVECLEPSTLLGLDPNTMPVAITATTNPSTGVVTYACDVCPWLQRQTGNPTLSPDPGFVLDFLTDIAWYRGRLALLYNDGVVFSDSANPFNFYTTTLATDLDSDPVGFLTPANRKAQFKRIDTFDNRCILMGDKIQAIVSSNGAFTAANARIDLLGNYDMNPITPILSSNHRTYFAASPGWTYLPNGTGEPVQQLGPSLIYELAIDRLSGLALTEEMTQAVPNYLPNNMDLAATCPGQYINVYGVSGATKIYVHIPRYQDQNRVQNSFYQWNLPTGFFLWGIFFKGNILRLLLCDDTTTSISYAVLQFQMDLTPFTSDGVPPSLPTGEGGFFSVGGTVMTYLDIKLPETNTTRIYNSTSGLTKVTPIIGFPFDFLGTPTVVARESSFVIEPGGAFREVVQGYKVPVVEVDTTSLYLQGDWTGTELPAQFFIGLLYSSYFIPTRWYIRGQDGKPQHTGRLSLRRAKFDVSSFSNLNVAIYVDGRVSPHIYSFEGLYTDEAPIQNLGTTNNAGPTFTLPGLDQVQKNPTAVLSVPINGNSERTSLYVFNQSYLGFTCLGFEWQGDWNARARRVT